MSETSSPIYRRVIRDAVAIVGLLFCLFCMWMAALTGLSRLSSTSAAYTGQLNAAEEAVRLAPSDAEAHLIRGAILKEEEQLNEAIREFEQAAALRPRDYLLWLELGLARDQAEDQAGAIAALKESVRLAPSYAEPHWQLGNVELRAGRVDEAFAEMRRAAASNPVFLPQLIDLAWSIYNGDVPAIERAVEPQTPAARLALARFAAKRGKPTEAARLFRTIENVSGKDIHALLTDLLAAKQFNTAYEVWSIGVKRDERNSGSGFTDGGFEERITNNEPGFGWQIVADLQSLRVSVDKVQPHNGGSSLRLDLKGDSNPASPLVSQLVLVEPDGHYRLRFAVRTEELVTGGLPVVAIIDAGSNDSKQLAQTEPIPPKTTPWKDYSVEFATGKETQAVLVVLRRQNCPSSPCPIFGRVWLDDFSLQKF